MLNLLILSLSLLLFTSCKTPTRPEINAKIWLNNAGGNSLKAICAREEALKDFGFYRRLNNGKLEFVSFCSSTSTGFVAITEKDFNEILDKYIPEPPQENP